MNAAAWVFGPGRCKTPSCGFSARSGQIQLLSVPSTSSLDASEGETAASTAAASLQLQCSPELYSIRSCPDLLRYFKDLMNTKRRWRSLTKSDQAMILKLTVDIVLQPMIWLYRREKGNGKLKAAQNKLNLAPSAEVNTYLGFLSSTLWSLGKIGADYEDFDSEFLIKVWNVMDMVRPGSHTSKIVYSLASLRLPWRAITTKTRNQLVTSIIEECQTMNELAIVNLVYSLGKMEMKWTVLPTAAKVEIYNALERVSPQMDDRAVANVLWALGKCNAKWTNLPVSLRTALSVQLEEKIPIGPQALSSSVAGLQHMGLTFPAMELPLRTTILANLPHAMSSCNNEQALSTTLWALGSMDFKYHHFDNTTHEAIDSAICRITSSFSEQGFSNVLQGLTKMKWPSNKLSADMRASIEAPLLKILTSKPSSVPKTNSAKSNSRTRSISSIIWSLGNNQYMSTKLTNRDSECEYDDSFNNAAVDTHLFLEKHILDALCVAIDQNVHKMNPHEIFVTFSGMAKMKLDWSSLPESTRTTLLQSLERSTPKMEKQAVSNTLWAFGTMGARWPEINDKLKKVLVGVIISTLSSMDAQSLSITLYSLAKLECKYSTFSTPLKQALVSSCIECSHDADARELAIQLYSLGRMSASFRKSLPRKLQESILKSLTISASKMTEQNLANCVWGLCGHMDMPFSELPEDCKTSLTKAIVVKAKNLSTKATMSILHGLSRPDGQNWNNDLSLELQQSLLMAIDSAIDRSNSSKKEEEEMSRASSILAGNILYALGRLEMSWGYPSLELKNNLLLALNAASNKTNNIDCSRAISFGLNGLAHMTTWDKLRVETTHELLLFDSLRLGLPYAVPADLANILWSLGRLNISAKELPEDVLSETFLAIDRSIYEMSAFELAWTIWALDRMNLTFSEIPPTTYSATMTSTIEQLKGMEMRELGIVMYAITNMKVPMTNPLVEEIFKKLNDQ